MKKIGKYVPFLMLVIAFAFNSCSKENELYEENSFEFKSLSIEFIPENFKNSEIENIEYENNDENGNLIEVQRLINPDAEEAYIVKSGEQELFIETKNQKLTIINLLNGELNKFNYVFDEDLGYSRIQFPDLEKYNQLVLKNNDCYNGCTAIFVLNQVGITTAFLAACATDGPLPFADALATTAFLSFSAANGASYEKCKAECED